MSAFLPCSSCGADDASPCLPGCSCELCRLKALPSLAPDILPDSIDGCLALANSAAHQRYPDLAAFHMVRLVNRLLP